MLSELQSIPTLVNKATAYKTAWKLKEAMQTRETGTHISVHCAKGGLYCLFMYDFTRSEFVCRDCK